MNGSRVSRWLLACIVCLACKTEAPSLDESRCAADVAPLPARIQRGISLAHNYQRGGSKGYGSPTSAETLGELVDLGVEWVSLTPFGFMRSLDEEKVHFIGDYPGGETDARMQAVFQQAKGRGLKILLKPHLWIARGAWRGEIAFADASGWDNWFDSYERWILHYAEMAQRHDVDALVVGVELRSSQLSQESRWRRLIQKVRERFKGSVTYSANWDDAADLPWWDVLDYIGVQFYPPLAEGSDARVESVERRVAARLDELEGLSARYGKPVLFTEVGYRAAPDALRRPHAWPERSGIAEFDPRPQTLGYRAFIGAVRGRPWVRGIYWWKWFTDPNTSEEGPMGFSPRGKPAEAILRAAYAGHCADP